MYCTGSLLPTQLHGVSAFNVAAPNKGEQCSSNATFINYTHIFVRPYSAYLQVHFVCIYTVQIFLNSSVHILIGSIMSKCHRVMQLLLIYCLYG